MGADLVEGNWQVFGRRVLVHSLNGNARVVTGASLVKFCSLGVREIIHRNLGKEDIEVLKWLDVMNTASMSMNVGIPAFLALQYVCGTINQIGMIHVSNVLVLLPHIARWSSCTRNGILILAIISKLDPEDGQSVFVEKTIVSLILTYRSRFWDIVRGSKDEITSSVLSSILRVGTLSPDLRLPPVDFPTLNKLFGLDTELVEPYLATRLEKISEFVRHTTIVRPHKLLARLWKLYCISFATELEQLSTESLSVLTLGSVVDYPSAFKRYIDCLKAMLPHFSSRGLNQYITAVNSRTSVDHTGRRQCVLQYYYMLCSTSIMQQCALATQLHENIPTIFSYLDKAIPFQASSFQARKLFFECAFSILRAIAKNEWEVDSSRLLSQALNISTNMKLYTEAVDKSNATNEHLYILSHLRLLLLGGTWSPMKIQLLRMVIGFCRRPCGRFGPEFTDDVLSEGLDIIEHVIMNMGSNNQVIHTLSSIDTDELLHILEPRINNPNLMEPILFRLASRTLVFRIGLKFRNREVSLQELLQQFGFHSKWFSNDKYISLRVARKLPIMIFTHILPDCACETDSLELFQLLLACLLEPLPQGNLELLCKLSKSALLEEFVHDKLLIRDGSFSSRLKLLYHCCNRLARSDGDYFPLQNVCIFSRLSLYSQKMISVHPDEAYQSYCSTFFATIFSACPLLSIDLLVEHVNYLLNQDESGLIKLSVSIPPVICSLSLVFEQPVYFRLFSRLFSTLACNGSSQESLEPLVLGISNILSTRGLNPIIILLRTVFTDYILSLEHRLTTSMLVPRRVIYVLKKFLCGIKWNDAHVELLPPIRDLALSILSVLSDTSAVIPDIPLCRDLFQFLDIFSEINIKLTYPATGASTFNQYFFKVGLSFLRLNIEYNCQNTLFKWPDCDSTLMLLNPIETPGHLDYYERYRGILVGSRSLVARTFTKENFGSWMDLCLDIAITISKCAYNCNCPHFERDILSCIESLQEVQWPLNATQFAHELTVYYMSLLFD